MTKPGPIYDRSRYPKRLAKGKCRGCGEPVPKGRKSWCSAACYERFCPAAVTADALKRDRGVCALCGVNTLRIGRRIEKASTPTSIDLAQCRTNWWLRPITEQEWLRARQIIDRHWRQREAVRRKRLATMAAAGWETWGHRRQWELDHIKPFSEGGLTVIENVRTLCLPCHKKRTADWRRTKGQPA